MKKTFKLRFEDAVFASEDLTMTEKVVALGWAHRSNYETGWINESRFKTSLLGIAKKVGCSEKTARTATKALESKGWMAATPVPGQVSTYQLLIPTPVTLTGVTEDDEVVEETDPGNSYTTTPVAVTGLDKNPGSSYRGTPVTATDNKNSKNLTTKDSKDDAADAACSTSSSLTDVVIESPSLIEVSDSSLLTVVEDDAALVIEEDTDPGNSYTPVTVTEVEDEIARRAGLENWGSDLLAHVTSISIRSMDKHDGDAASLVEEVVEGWVEW